MKRRLVDVNVWLAMLVKEHAHHRLARSWFEALAAGEAGLCRLVQLALIRLLGNPTIMGPGALSAAEAWNLIAELLRDERVEFLTEPADLDSIFPNLLRYPVPTPNLIADAYLAAFAMSSSLPVATLDRGFQQFRGLQLELPKA